MIALVKLGLVWKYTQVNLVWLLVTHIFEYVNLPKYMKDNLGNVRNIGIQQHFTRATKHNYQN